MSCVKRGSQRNMGSDTFLALRRRARTRKSLGSEPRVRNHSQGSEPGYLEQGKARTSS